MQTKKIFLPESEIPRQWYNVAADMPTPMEPPLHPGTGQPVGPEDLAPIFPMPLIEQEVSQERFIDIPDEVLEQYLIWRPSPLYRAYGLEKFLDTPAKIYFKNEGVSPAGSHKPNTAIAQAYYNKISGTKRIITETGAGQWGSALSYCCALFGLECKVYMVKVSYQQKPYRRMMMETWGGTCVASPSTETEAGRKILAQNPDSPGSLGIAISEAVEVAVQDDEAKYSLGSVLNHVMLHQTVNGLECQKQMAIAGDYPDIIIGCAMHTLGHTFVPEGIHAGGLRYHGMAPLISQLILDNIIRPVAIAQLETFEAGITFAKTEGFISAPETTHAIAEVIRQAIQAKEEAKEKVILFNWSGHGLVDMAAYDAYLSGKLADHELAQEEIQRALDDIAPLPKPKQYTG
jgi:tryptophan synthase beta chain